MLAAAATNSDTLHVPWLLYVWRVWATQIMINIPYKSYFSASITPSGSAAITIISIVELHITELCNIVRWCNMMKDQRRMVFRSGMPEASASMNTSQCVCVGPTSPTPGLEFHSCRTSSLSVKTKATTLANHFSSAPLIFVSILHHPLLISHSSIFSFTCCVCLAAFTRCSSPPQPESSPVQMSY